MSLHNFKHLIFIDLKLIEINFRIEMHLNSAHVEIFDNIDEDVESEEVITDLDLEIKREKMNEKINIKTEVLEETNNSELFQIIGEKRKNQ
jgi:hypothetical protein